MNLCEKDTRFVKIEEALVSSSKCAGVVFEIKISVGVWGPRIGHNGVWGEAGEGEVEGRDKILTILIRKRSKSPGLIFNCKFKRSWGDLV